MANPIIPSGYSTSGSILSEAQRQDLERMAREAQDHFAQTGEELPPAIINDPLVPINGYSDPPNVANDGDSYAEDLSNVFQVPDPNAYIENSPTQLITNPPSRFSTGVQEYLRNERVAGLKRSEAEEAEDEEDRKFKESMKEAKKKFHNATSGLDLDVEE